jgi:hypothetical protein
MEHFVNYTDGVVCSRCGIWFKAKRGHQCNAMPFEGYTRDKREGHVMSNMNFGNALQALKDGKKVARHGWNGKNMWVIFVPGSKLEKLYEGSAYAKHMSGPVTIRPHLDMCNADGQMQPGWLASQSDMLSDDWFIVAETSEAIAA